MTTIKTAVLNDFQTAIDGRGELSLMHERVQELGWLSRYSAGLRAG
jgi:hypothetical protein